MQKISDCPQPLNPVVIVVATIVSAVLLGILSLIIWRYLRTKYDAREYKRFQLELENKRWNEVYYFIITSSNAKCKIDGY